MSEDEWQTRTRGTNEDEYEIYLANTADNPPLTFDEWLNGESYV